MHLLRGSFQRFQELLEMTVVLLRVDIRPHKLFELNQPILVNFFLCLIDLSPSGGRMGG
jgi:hypothetical protein